MSSIPPTVFLSARNLSVKYGKLYAVRDVSLRLDGGNIGVILGADGSGKSSLLLALAGLKRFEGEVEICGVAFRNPKEAQKVRRLVAFIPEGLGRLLYPKLTVEEHVNLFLKLKKGDPSFARTLLEITGLKGHEYKKASELSGGMKQKLAIVCAVLNRPPVLLMDQPTSGVDPLSRLQLWELFEDFKREGKVIALSTDYVSEGKRADLLAVLEKGRLVERKKPSEILKTLREYTYREIPCEDNYCFTFGGRTYSLKPLNVPKAEPDLQGLFFVKALKEGGIKVPELKIKSDYPEGEPLLIVKGAFKRFGKFVAVDKVDLTVKGGEIVLLAGPNGAGKTTLVRIILGLLKPDGGKVELKTAVGYVPQGDAFYRGMTLRENFLYFGTVKGLGRKELLQKLRDFSEGFSLENYLDLLPEEVSFGIRRRFALALALLDEPRLLILDEPTSGVDPVARAQFWKLFQKLKERGFSILITTHHLEEMALCDRVVFMHRGRKIFEATAEEVKKLKGNREYEEFFAEVIKNAT